MNQPLKPGTWVNNKAGELGIVAMQDKCAYRVYMFDEEGNYIDSVWYSGREIKPAPKPFYAKNIKVLPVVTEAYGAQEEGLQAESGFINTATGLVIIGSHKANLKALQRICALAGK